MKSKHLRLNKPCNEKWEDMKSSNLGSFCKSCSKTVIDFSQLDEFEIASKIKHSKGDICARITQKQMNTQKQFSYYN